MVVSATILVATGAAPTAVGMVVLTTTGARRSERIPKVFAMLIFAIPPETRTHHAQRPGMLIANKQTT